MSRRKDSLKLIIKQALLQHTGKKVARIPDTVRQKLGVKIGDKISIKTSKNQIIRTVVAGLEEESGQDIIGIDQRDRQLIGLDAGRKVEVRKATKKDLREILPTEVLEPEKNIWLFCYGSNNPQQLGERIGRKVVGHAAYLPGYERVFRGFSQKWGGGTASLQESHQPNIAVYGYATQITPEELEILDGFEGVNLDIYERRLFKIYIKIGNQEQYIHAYAYTSKGDKFNEPSKQYLRAIVKTISPFWVEPDGRKISTRDIPIKRYS